MYWVEEELEAEWESSKSKSTREVTQYETTVVAADALADHDAPLTLSMGDVRDVSTGWTGGLPTYLIHYAPKILATNFKLELMNSCSHVRASWPKWWWWR